MIVHIMAGNSDDKLTQAEWSALVEQIDEILDAALGQTGVGMHGRWFSAPDAPWQNACWCVDLPQGEIGIVQAQLSGVAQEYRQDWIAWHEVRSVYKLEPDTFTDRS